MTTTTTTTSATLDWSDAAPAWDARRGHVERMKAPLTSELLRRLDLRPGERVLELGAGTGELALRLSDAVGPDGHVTASDVSPGMVDLLRRTTDGRAGVTVEMVDARAIALPDESVDAVVFRMGLMLVEDPASVLRECRRVLRSPGRLALAVWAAPEHNAWLLCVGMAAMMHGLVSGGPPTGPGGPFSLADPDALSALVRDAGFAEVAVDAVETPATFATTDEYFDIVIGLAAPLADAYARAPEETRRSVRQTAAELAERHRTAAGLVLPGRALLCSARS